MSRSGVLLDASMSLLDADGNSTIRATIVYVLKLLADGFVNRPSYFEAFSVSCSKTNSSGILARDDFQVTIHKVTRVPRFPFTACLKLIQC